MVEPMQQGLLIDEAFLREHPALRSIDEPLSKLLVERSSTPLATEQWYLLVADLEAE